MGRYSGTKIKKRSLLPRDKKVVDSYETTIYKVIPESNSDLHLISTEGDRLDNLAFQYYNDSSLWWYLAKANNLTDMNIPAGTKLRIPSWFLSYILYT